MAKILRMAGTEHVWELDESVDLEQRAREIAGASTRNEVVGLTARLPGQAQWSFVSMNPAQLAWWSLGEEAGFSLSD
jgi:hypothetical protein